MAPIIEICDTQQEEVIRLVDDILTKNKDSAANITEIESKIDALVFQLYSLTDPEIRLVEGG